MEWHEDLQNLAQQQGLKGKKLNKARTPSRPLVYLTSTSYRQHVPCTPSQPLVYLTSTSYRQHVPCTPSQPLVYLTSTSYRQHVPCTPSQPLVYLTSTSYRQHVPCTPSQPLVYLTSTSYRQHVPCTPSQPLVYLTSTSYRQHVPCTPSQPLVYLTSTSYRQHVPCTPSQPLVYLTSTSYRQHVPCTPSQPLVYLTSTSYRQHVLPHGHWCISPPPPTDNTYSLTATGVSHLHLLQTTCTPSRPLVYLTSTSYRQHVLPHGHWCISPPPPTDNTYSLTATGVSHLHLLQTTLTPSRPLVYLTSTSYRQHVLPHGHWCISLPPPTDNTYSLTATGVSHFHLLQTTRTPSRPLVYLTSTSYRQHVLPHGHWCISLPPPTDNTYSLTATGVSHFHLLQTTRTPSRPLVYLTSTSYRQHVLPHGHWCISLPPPTDNTYSLTATGVSHFHLLQTTRTPSQPLVYLTSTSYRQQTTFQSYAEKVSTVFHFLAHIQVCGRWELEIRKYTFKMIR